MGVGCEIDATLAAVFAARELPELVFQPAIQDCAWIYFDTLACVDGWTWLAALAASHGDNEIRVSYLDGDGVGLSPVPLRGRGDPGVHRDDVYLQTELGRRA